MTDLQEMALDYIDHKSDADPGPRAFREVAAKGWARETYLYDCGAEGASAPQGDEWRCGPLLWVPGGGWVARWYTLTQAGVDALAAHERWKAARR